MYVPSIGAYLVEEGHDVKVVAFCSEENPGGYPFPVVAIPRGPLPVRYLKALWRVWREARGVDVVYVNEHLALFHVLGARLARKPVVIRMMVDGAWEISHRKGWIGGDDIVTFETKDYGWQVKLTRFLQRRWWASCSRMVAVSEFLRQIAVRRYGVPETKAVKVFNAYHGPTVEDVAATPAQAREELGLDGSKRYLLTICRLMVWKGVDGILQALRELPDDVELLIAGDGPEEDAWKQQALDLGLGARAHFLGNVPYERIPLFIRAAEVFVLNSEYEGLSHTLLEVQALGTPIVCTGVCGNPEVVEDGVSGMLVPTRSPGELAGALSRVLGDSGLRARFVGAGLERAALFTRTATFPRVEALLKDAARL